MKQELNFSAFGNTTDLTAASESGHPINAGWLPPENRDTVSEKAHSVAVESTPVFILSGKSANDNTTKVCLWDCWKNWLGVRQVTGSCVGAGGGNALYSLAAADIYRRKDSERLEVPFWLLPYGVSRMLAGFNDRGDGSMGSTFAQAVREYGHIPANLDGLPQYKIQDGVVWGEKVELDWSQGRKIPASRLEESRKYLVKSTAKCRSTDDVREAIKNYFSVTCASNWGGQMRPAVSNGVLLNRRATVWNHQMSVQAWWDHPQLGELFWIQNQWGIDVHGRCPSGAPGGGFWVNKSDMTYIVNQGETFAFSQFDGFPALDEPLNFSAF